MSVRRGTHPTNEQKIHRFPNGFGASVVRGPYTYGGPEGLFELAVAHYFGESPDWHIDYDTPITSDVEGHLTENDVQELLDRIAELPPRRQEDCTRCSEGGGRSEEADCVAVSHHPVRVRFLTDRFQFARPSSQVHLCTREHVLNHNWVSEGEVMEDREDEDWSPRWMRHHVRCTRCGESRRVAIQGGLDRPGLVEGCSPITHNLQACGCSKCLTKPSLLSRFRFWRLKRAYG